MVLKYLRVPENEVESETLKVWSLLFIPAIKLLLIGPSTYYHSYLRSSILDIPFFFYLLFLIYIYQSCSFLIQRFEIPIFYLIFPINIYYYIHISVIKDIIQPQKQSRHWKDVCTPSFLTLKFKNLYSWTNFYNISLFEFWFENFHGLLSLPI